MELSPKPRFPNTYEAIYYPGRLTMPWGAVAVGLVVCAVMSVHTGFAVTQPAGIRRLTATVFSGVWAVGTGAALIGALLNYLRCAVALTGEGLSYRNWLGRVWFIAWEDVIEVSVKRELDSRGGGYMDSAFLTWGALPGHPRTSRRIVASSRSWIRSVPPPIQAGPIKRAIIDRLDLRPEERSRYEHAWVRAKGNQSPAPSAAGPATKDCAGRGETFPAETTTCPQYGRPVPAGED